jgi:hypothetical protein
LAGRVLLKIVYLLTCRVLGVAVLVFRGDGAKDAELLVLRHENAVLRRHVGRLRYEPADRVWFAALAWLVPRRRRAEIFPVTPATLLAWHRKLAAMKYDTRKRRKPGRPPTVQSIARLVLRLAKENPLWGYRRIHCELTKPGLAVAPSTVSPGMSMTYANISEPAVLADYQSVLQPGAVIAGPLAETLCAGQLGHDALDWLKTNFYKTELELGHCLRLPQEGPCECDLYLTCAKFVTTPPVRAAASGPPVPGEATGRRRPSPRLGPRSRPSPPHR